MLNRECLHILRGHISTVRCMRVLDSRPIAISGSRDATLRVWNIDTGESIHVLSGHEASVRCIEISGNKVVSGSYDSTCRVSCLLYFSRPSFPFFFPSKSIQKLMFFFISHIVMGRRHRRMSLHFPRTRSSNLFLRLRRSTSSHRIPRFHRSNLVCLNR